MHMPKRWFLFSPKPEFPVIPWMAHSADSAPCQNWKGWIANSRGTLLFFQEQPITSQAGGLFKSRMMSPLASHPTLLSEFLPVVCCPAPPGPWSPFTPPFKPFSFILHAWLHTSTHTFMRTHLCTSVTPHATSCLHCLPSCYCCMKAAESFNAP